MSELTTKQQKFVDVFCGNASEAARAAGYSCPGIAGHHVLKNPKVQAAIDRRDAESKKKDILTREERQLFWSQVIRGEEKDRVIDQRSGREKRVSPSLSDRLKASELLGRSNGDFLDRTSLEGKVNTVIIHDPDSE